MYLDKIELHGFKSFANRTVIDFPKPPNKSNHGITVIVGPNGSGKSNIIDALRWVLGEQSTKTLRGKKGQDVIFSGSNTKPRMGMAEVTLFFNNEDKQAPIDYPEIVITRRLYRDGESEYIMNNNKVRLNEIVMLLAQAHVGQKSYSIIGQGMITKIISSTPTERKAFFDEATGIKQYQIKRDQAVNKLRRTTENLEQSGQIITELEPRLRLLKRQVTKLEQRKVLEKELRELQAKYYSSLWQNLDTHHKKYSQQILIQEKEQKSLEIKITDLQSKIEKLSQGASRESTYNALQKDYNDLIFQKNTLTQELAIVKGKTNIEYTKLGKQNLSWLELKEDEIKQKLTELKEEEGTINQSIQKQQLDLEKKNNALITITQDLERVDQALFSAQRDDQNNFVYTKSHIRTLTNQKDSISGIISTVNELASVETKYARALEIAAGRYIEAIVVKNEDAARDGIRFLKENRLGTATFLPLNKITPRRVPLSTQNMIGTHGVVDLAINLVKFPSEYNNIFSFIFGSTLIVDNIEAAKIIGVGSERMVTLDGDLLERNGVIRGGFRRYKSSFNFGSSSNTVNAQELEKLEQKRIDLMRQKQGLETEINQIKIEIEIAKSKLSMTINTNKALQVELQKIKLEIQHNNIDPENRDQMLADLMLQKEKLQQNVDTLEVRIQEKRNKIDLFNREEEEKKQQLFTLQNEIQVEQASLNSINSELNNLKIQVARVETKKEDLISELIDELGINYNTHIIIPKIEIDIEHTHKHIQVIKQKLSIIGGIDPEIIEEYNEVQQRFDFLSTQKADLEEALIHTTKIINELDEVIKKQFNTAFRKINKEFSRFFSKLFEGGKAKLELMQQEQMEQTEIKDDQGNIIDTENEETSNSKKRKQDLITTGIEILVNPPNKKISNLSMLSGGEKTMTAIALICAIIANNAPPFVFLDEVDAALDEANSAKLGAILTELGHITQFIIITHNRTIMHSADVLYGVAMGNDGITQMLSLNIAQADKLAQNIPK